MVAGVWTGVRFSNLKELSYPDPYSNISNRSGIVTWKCDSGNHWDLPCGMESCERVVWIHSFHLPYIFTQRGLCGLTTPPLPYISVFSQVYHLQIKFFCPKSVNCRKMDVRTADISTRRPAEMSTDQDWIGLDRTEANFGRIRTRSDYNFCKLAHQVGSDWENFCCFNEITLKISKILVVIRFHRLAKW